MKDVIKKISAFTMAFTLLGTGTAITSSIAPQLNCVITASAAESVTSKFSDVNPGDWFAEAVQFVYDRYIMNGTSDNTFSPQAEVTREQFVTALFNMADDPQKYDNTYDNCFTDVGKDKWYTTPIMWAYHWGITSGYGSKFGVGDKISREQLVTMLYNYETKFKKRPCNAPTNALDKFKDRRDVSGFALTPMRWAVSQKIISGKGDNKLAPNDTATRAECAQVIKNYLVKGNMPVDRLMAVVRSEIGYKEKLSKDERYIYDKNANAGGNNFTKYAYEFDTYFTNWYNGKKNGYEWCDMFVDWCFLKAFGYNKAQSLLCQTDNSTGAGCLNSMNFYKNNGQFIPRGNGVPKPGDQIFFYYPSDKQYHTGIVESVDSSKVYTIEGNAGNQVARRSYSLKDSSIVGYGRPAY